MQIHFDNDLSALKDRLKHMGSQAERMVQTAVRALVSRDTAELDAVFAIERGVNALHVEVDNRALDLIALHQPVAGDLRLLVMAIKISSEVERIADQAVNIAQNTKIYLQHPPLKPLIDLPMMTDAATQMLHKSLDAFIRKDAGLAQEVLDADDTVDAFKDQIFRELLTYMMSDPASIPRALCLILISRNLERIGDHATNIAEEVIYLEQGRDVRHQSS